LAAAGNARVGLPRRPVRVFLEPARWPFSRKATTTMSEPSSPAALPAGTAGFLDHIGIAVRDLDAAITLYRDLLGLQLEHVEEVASERVRVAMLRLDHASRRGHVELLAPLDEDSHIAQFIAKRGPGLHHIALAATDVAAVMQRCREAGCELLDAQPRTGAGGKRIVFLHPRSGGGVLIEICQQAPARPDDS
jgi:methylmalonyl-CoA/ethylmalonyl-CoA epimerase